MKKQFRDFESAREFVQNLGLKNRDDWYEYCKSGEKPDDIPTSPRSKYKKDFKGWGSFLGTQRIAYQDKQYRSFIEAREFVRRLGLKNRDDWMEFSKSANKPDDIPTSPRSKYKKDFKGWGDFLGTGVIANQNKSYLSFEQAREFVRRLGLKNRDDWRAYLKSDKKPEEIPFFPEGTYKKDFKGMGDWLGTGTVSSVEQSKKWLPFKDARIEAQKIAKEFGISDQKEWIKAHKEGKIPDFLPRYPYDIYGKKKSKK